MTDQLVVTAAGGVGQVVLNNPERLNALSPEMRAALPDALAELAHDPAVRVIVLTGAGDRAFCAGADIASFDARSGADVAPSATRASWGELREMFTGTQKPVIAKIRGYCLGGGLCVALQADIRIAAEGSRFGIPAARLGLGFPVEGVAAILEVAGPAWTADILFSGRHLGAEEALRAGLVNRVVAADDLDAAVAALAEAIAANAPLSVAAARAALVELRRPAGERDLGEAERLVAACAGSDDFLEGRSAFREKRVPVFRGR